MLAANFKRTKIIITLGPASESAEMIEKLIAAGANGIRLNFSHGTYEEFTQDIKYVRAAAAKLGKPVAIIADLQGPKFRIGNLPLTGVPLVRKHTVSFRFGTDYEKTGIIPIQHDFSAQVKPGQTIYLHDGQVEAIIKRCQDSTVTAEVISPGIIKSNHGINLPDTRFKDGIFTPKDLEDLEFIMHSDIDYVAHSFVQNVTNIKTLREKLIAKKSQIGIIAKIETKAACEDLEAIVQASDAVMVARGDLAIEIQPEVVPIIQKQIIALARKYQKIAIVATQMLESMIKSLQPSRAEVSDVATAVSELADSVMLSAETAVGNYPLETVEMMKRIICTNETSILKTVPELNFNQSDQGNAISAAAVILARKIGAKVIIAETSSGQTARNLSALRPSMPIIMTTYNLRVYNQLAISWGGKSYYVRRAKDLMAVADSIIKLLRTAGNIKTGDFVVVANGNQPGISGRTDTVRMRVVN